MSEESKEEAAERTRRAKYDQLVRLHGQKLQAYNDLLAEYTGIAEEACQLLEESPNQSRQWHEKATQFVKEKEKLMDSAHSKLLSMARQLNILRDNIEQVSKPKLPQ